MPYALGSAQPSHGMRRKCPAGPARRQEYLIGPPARLNSVSRGGQHVLGPASAPSSSLARLLVAGLTHAPLARDVMKRDPQAVHRTVRLVDRLVDLAARVEPGVYRLAAGTDAVSTEPLTPPRKTEPQARRLSCTLPRDPRLPSPAREALGEHSAEPVSGTCGR